LLSCLTLALLERITVDISVAACPQALSESSPSFAEPAKQKSLPIKFHTLAGLNRVDLDDDEADDETYRAFQLARYTGEANMLIKQHEQEFMRKRKREREERELGDSRGNAPNTMQQQDSRVFGEQPQQQPQQQQQQPQKKNRMEEIMGGNSLEEEVLVQIGEGAETTQLPFDAVHVSKSGDIEDEDQHFVMTDQMRHKELKNAVTESSEQDSEAQAQAVAKTMQHQQEKISEFNARQAAKDRKDMKTLADERELGEAMHAHHLQLDDKGRVIPDF